MDEEFELDDETIFEKENIQITIFFKIKYASIF